MGSNPVSDTLKVPCGEGDFISLCLGLPICKMGSGEAKKFQPYHVPSAALSSHRPWCVWVSTSSGLLAVPRDSELKAVLGGQATFSLLLHKQN